MKLDGCLRAWTSSGAPRGHLHQCAFGTAHEQPCTCVCGNVLDCDRRIAMLAPEDRIAG